jgi:secreted trypsin-like serine protease
MRLLALALSVCVPATALAANATAGSPKLVHKSIIGGATANPAEWPFVVAIRDRGQPHCGGSVISPTKVLTAGHCVLGIPAADLTVITGRPNLTDTSVGQSIPVANTIAYPGFGGNSSNFDFGVITLAQPTTAPPVTLATAEESAAATAQGARLRVAGYGNQNPVKRRLSVVLRSVTQFSAGDRACFKEYGKRGLGSFDPLSEICVKGQRFRKFRDPEIRKKVQGRTSACNGDSGGPLIADTPAGPRQVGTVSFGPFFCGFRSKPSVYGRVAAGLAFINGS